MHPGRSGAFVEEFLPAIRRVWRLCRLSALARPQGAVDAGALLEPSAPRFVNLVHNSKSSIAEAAVRQIGQLYAIETTVRGLSPHILLAARKEHSLPIVAALTPWFENQLSMVSNGSTLAQDIRYALNHWLGLTRFLDGGRLGLDTNPVENAIRPICLTRKKCSSPVMRSGPKAGFA